MSLLKYRFFFAPCYTNFKKSERHKPLEKYTSKLKENDIMKKDYIINHGEQTITITKAFAARAADISTREYRELTKLHRDFPDYTIQHRTAVIRADKATYKGLTLDEMEKYIKAQDSSGEGVKAFEAIKVYHTPTGKDKPSYPKVKAWFLKTYPQYGKKEITEKPAA